MFADQLQEAPAKVLAAGPRRRVVCHMALAILAGVMAWYGFRVGYRSDEIVLIETTDLEQVLVDQGDVEEVVAAYGTLESGDDAVVRCQVESFLGLPTRALPGGPVMSSQMARPRAATATSPQASGPGSGGMTTPPATGRGKLRSADRFASVKGVRPGSSGTPKTTPTSSTDTRAKASTTPPGSANGPGATPASGIPEIRSFQYVVAPYVPLRTDGLEAAVSAGPPPPPPTILSIVPEGTRVKAGEVVCELDSSAFHRELLAQQARHVRAKGWVDKARSLLEVNEITLREFVDGLFPQDVERIRQLIRTCETERGLAERNLAWSRETAGRGFRSRQQVAVDEFALEKTEISLADARGMLNRLVNYTGTKLVKAIKARIEANRADLLALKSSHQLESERLKRIEAMIANCTLRAPRDGMVIHANRANGWGRAETQIQEGLTVYQTQPIFRILDPAHVQVKVRINESQIAKIRTGQPALIRFDAYPERLLRGTVADITPIPALASGPISDVHSCYATVRFDGRGFETLQLGLSAEVDFLVEARSQVTRIPLDSVQFADDDAYAAVPSHSASGPGWRWKPIELGASDAAFAEVRSGLKPGDPVIAHPGSLPAPEPDSTGPGTDVALVR
jgi:HlyD family secretion protein